MTEDQIRNKPDKKVVIVGDVSVGKSCLIARYIDQVFSPTKMTIGTSFFVKQWNNKNIALWDTAGQEQYDGLRGFYCRGADAMILCYNICDRNSFTSLRHKYAKCFEQVGDGCLIVLVGTQSDRVNQVCPDNRNNNNNNNNDNNNNNNNNNNLNLDVDVLLRRTVTVDEAMDLYVELKGRFNTTVHPSGSLPIFETSSKTGRNVDCVFEYIFDTLVPSSITRPQNNGREKESGLVRLLERNLSEEAQKKDCCAIG